MRADNLVDRLLQLLEAQRLMQYGLSFESV